MWLSVGILLVLVVSGAGILFYACAVPSAEIFSPVLTRGPADLRRVTLTFDDGPSPYTAQILDILREHKIKATFFLCGANVERLPDVAKRIASEGHTIGNHTFSHPALCFKTSGRIANEIDRTQAVIEKAVALKPIVFRPPFGVRWPGLMGILRSRNLKLVMWSATGYDWKYSADKIVTSATNELHPGAVVLLHDGHETLPAGNVDRSQTVKSLPRIIASALQNGYEFVPLDQFLES